MLRPTWDQFADMLTLRDQVNRLFEESTSRLPSRERREGLPQRAWAPLVDIFEDADKIVLHADLPGVSQDAISVEIEGDTLIIRGERRLEDQSRQDCLRAERVSGPFVRTFTLTTPVQTDKVTASYRDGVLEAILPKAEAAKPRRIAIVSASQP